MDGVSETTVYIWNDDNRLVRVELPNGDVIEYVYDDEGIRVSTTVNGEKTEYLIDKNQPYAQVLEEFKSGDLEAFYVYGNDLISQTRNGERDVYHVDGLGSTRALTDETGNVSDNYDYDAFGELIGSEGESENSYRFAGEQFDEEFGQYYLRQRFYNPGVGRFTRRDTYEGRLREPVTLHKYLYGSANPVNRIDPSGLFDLSLANLTMTQKVGGILATIGAVGIVVDSGPPEYPGGFGEGPQPSIPSHTGHKREESILRKLLGLRGFADGPQPDLPSHTGHPPDKTLDDLIRYIFSIYNEEAYDIAYGHAWSKHYHDSWVPLGINGELELAELIDNIMTFPSDERELRDNRKAYWDDSTGVVVINDPGDQDRGTAFRPDEGKSFFNRLK